MRIIFIRFITLLFSGVALMLTFACAPENPKRQPPPEENVVEDIYPEVLEEDANFRVDVLFVVDDSASMMRHQRNLSQNIKKFIPEFEKNAHLDFHIGVTSVFDSRIEELVKTDPKLQGRQVDINPLGHLLPLRDKNGEILPGLKYVTKDTPNYLEVLERTLLVGAKPGPDQKTATIGPLYEELFTPVQHVFLNENSNGPNSGFYREDAVLAVIFITDANDDSPSLTPSELYDFLLDLKGGQSNKVQAYAAIIPTQYGPSQQSCRRDDSLEPREIEQFLSMFENSKDRILNLCTSDFGKKLAEFSKDIVNKVPPKILVFPAVPERDSIEVYYGGEKLEEGKHYDYSVGPPGVPHRIIINKDFGLKFGLKFVKGARFRLKYHQLDTQNQDNGLAKKI